MNECSRQKPFAGVRRPAEPSPDTHDSLARRLRRRSRVAAKISIPHLLDTVWAAGLAAVAVLALSACSSMKVGLGMRVNLAKTPIASMKASLPQGPGIAPGEKLPLVVTFTEPNGKVLVTEGQGKGKVMWTDLTVVTTVVTVNQKGVLSLSKDPRVSDGKVPHVTITVPSSPGLRAELDVPLRYDYKFVANFSGKPGASGLNGLDGSDGASGTMGSNDPNNPSPGGNGSNGTDGSDGKDGERGGDAPSVDVRVAPKFEDRPLLQVSVTAAGNRKLYLVDPQGGSLTVKADGGPGGSGGRGGRGGRGGSGGSGTPDGMSGSNGSDGRNGFDGPPGKGGRITVTYDPATKLDLGALHFSSKGGPAPTFNEEAVAPLW
ncbi:MAG TPA: hypothetical protein VN822_08055 [Candidatus Acidoferrales bacterium]|nr:hypothetical protein [Candidatus Acidoferrales bacterium]